MECFLLIKEKKVKQYLFMKLTKGNFINVKSMREFLQ